LKEIKTRLLGKAASLAGPIRAAVSALEPQLIADVSKLAFGDPNVIPLWYGESDLPTPEFIRAAAKRALDEGETFYTHTRGIPPLREAIAEYLTALHALPVAAERVSVTTAGMNAIMLVMELVLEAGANAVTVTPLWPNAAAAARIMGAEPREVALQSVQGRWRLDLERLFAACDERTRLIFVNSPGNPTGWMMTREEQRALLDFCRERNIWLLADEVYSRIVYHGRAAPSFLDLAEPEDPLFVANSFSKAWAMTGWRMGWLVAPAALGDLLGELVQHNVSGVATFLQPAAITALKTGEPFVTEFVERCRRGRDIVADHLAAMPRVRFTPPEAAFYAFFEVEGVEDSLAFAKRIVREAGVGLAPGAAFGKGGEGGYLRLCFAQAPELLERAMERLKRVIV
jgi:aspartate/methionine/tyrosine aminotransferase